MPSLPQKALVLTNNIVVKVLLLSIIVGSMLSIIVAQTANTSYISPSITPTFKRVIFYYGWLNTSNLLDLDFDILVFSGATSSEKNAMIPVLQELKNRGVEIYAYLHEGANPIGLGSSFNDLVVNNGKTVDEWKNYIKQLVNDLIGNYTVNGELLIDGVFLDECDPSYFGTTDPNNPNLQSFTQALKEIVNYIHSKGLKVFINGVRAYAHLGDYYLWESFVAVYNDQTNDYIIDPNFFNTDNGNPYEWENGIAKYYWLKGNNTLDKTIALSYANLSSLNNAKLAYYVARILGLAGWAYAPHNIYAPGGRVTLLDVYEVGPAISDPVISTSTKTLSRFFLVGNITVDLSTNTLTLPFTYKTIRLDLNPTEYENTLAATGSSSRINLFGYLATQRGLQVYVEATWNTPPSPLEGLLHIYIDYDGDSSTGFTGIGGYGAEYLVEIYTNGDAILHEYTGAGSDWKWREIQTVQILMASTSATDYKVELLIPTNVYQVGTSRISIATIVSWNDDAYITQQPIDNVEPVLTIYDKPTQVLQYGPVIKEITLTNTYAKIIADAPTGTLANYTVHVPFKVAQVLKNGNPLPKHNNPTFTGEGYYTETIGSYTKVLIRVRHSSPVTITINPPTTPTPLGGKASPYTTLKPIILIAIVALIASLALNNIKKYSKN